MSLILLGAWTMRENESTQNRIIRNVGWSLAAKVTSLVGSLLVGIFVARYLGPDQYGLMNYVVSFNHLFLIIATFGFDNIEIREEAKNEGERDRILGTVFQMRMALSLITIMAICCVSCINETDRETFILIVVYSISVVMSPFDVIRNYFTSLVQNEYIAKVGMFRTAFSCLLKVVLLCIHAHLFLFVCSLVVDAMVLAQGYCYVYQRRQGRLRDWRFDRKWAKYILCQSFPLMLSGAAATVFLQIDQIMIGNMIDKGNVGYFSVASRFVEVMLYVPTVLIQTVCPLLVVAKKENISEYREKAQQFLNITLWICVIMSVIVSLLSYYIVRLTFGLQYYNSIAVLQVLAYKTVAVALNTVSGQILIIDEMQKLFVVRSLCGCVACVTLNYIVIPQYGIIGVAWVAIAAQLVSGFLIHAVIPQYRYVFRMQLRAVALGWGDLVMAKSLIRNIKS